MVESGRFLEDGIRRGTFDGTSMPAFRVASFGNTKIRVTLNAVNGSLDPVLLVDGPYPGAKPPVVAYNDDASTDTANSALEITLSAKGTYRLVVGSYAAFVNAPRQTGAYDLSFSCLDNCSVPQMSLAEFAKRLKADYGENVARDLMVERTSGLFKDPAIAAAVKDQAAKFLAGVGTTDKFPVIPLAALPAVQGFLEMAVRPKETVPPPPVIFDLDKLANESCKPDRGKPEVLSPRIPELVRHWETDYRYDDCSLRHMQQLGDVLNNLSMENGSAVVDNGRRYETVESAIRALIKAGHTIEATNNRYYADFLGLMYKGTSVSAPLWIDTGIALPGGGTLAVPVPHAHYHFTIEGPALNGELMFYMGIPGGTLFRAQHIYRKPWGGERGSVTRTSKQNLETIVSLFVTAGKLRKKWETNGAGLPAVGYGQLGVCIDSTAVLEMATEKTVTLFPLLHPAGKPPVDEIDALMATIPSDITGTGAATALERLVATQPFDPSKGVDLKATPFPTLKAGLEALGIAR
ncbi:MAG: hypothetical protein MUF54_09990 [Polyangiaceae bacterium]|nr:hypothetical protein [Polyangiaceae bacterium]